MSSAEPLIRKWPNEFEAERSERDEEHARLMEERRAEPDVPQRPTPRDETP